MVKSYEEVILETDFSKYSVEELEELGIQFANEIFHSFSMIKHHKQGLVAFDFKVREQSDLSRLGQFLITGVGNDKSIEDKIIYMDILKDFILYVGTLEYKKDVSVKKRFITSIQGILQKNNNKKRY